MRCETKLNSSGKFNYIREISEKTENTRLRANRLTYSRKFGIEILRIFSQMSLC